MGSLYKRNNKGNWISSHYDHQGRRRNLSTRTTDHRAAERILREREAKSALRREGVIDPRTDGYTAADRAPIQDHIEAYLEHCKQSDHAKRHLQGRRAQLMGLLKDSQVTRLADVTPELLQHRLKALRGSRSPRTCNDHRAAWVAFFNWCVKTSRIPENPLSIVPKMNEHLDRKRERRALNDDEIHRLIHVTQDIDEQNEAQYGPRWTPRSIIYLVAVLTGLRRGEIKKLTWGDVDLEAYSITIRVGVGKAKREDVIPIHPQAAEALASLKSAQLKPTDHVFKTMPSFQTVQKDFGRAGITRKDEAGRIVDFHALRTTFGTNLAQQSVPPQHAQRLMRHADYRTTQNHYTKLEVTDTRKAVKRLQSIGPTGNDSRYDSSAQQIRQQSVHASMREDASGCDKQEESGDEEGKPKSLDEGSSGDSVPTDATQCTPVRWSGRRDSSSRHSASMRRHNPFPRNSIPTSLSARLPFAVNSAHIVGACCMLVSDQSGAAILGSASK